MDLIWFWFDYFSCVILCVDVPSNGIMQKPDALSLIFEIKRWKTVTADALITWGRSVWRATKPNSEKTSRNDKFMVNSCSKTHREFSVWGELVYALLFQWMSSWQPLQGHYTRKSAHKRPEDKKPSVWMSSWEKVASVRFSSVGNPSTC